jgi:predicted ATPase
VDLGGGAIGIEPVEPLTLKGKSEPVPAYRLGAVRDAPERSRDPRFVGRDFEVALIRTAWERAVDDASCQLVAVVGDAGVGKSRLVAEALRSVDARTARGRCLSYGEAITYWPVVEVVKQLGARPVDPTAADAMEAVLARGRVAVAAGGNPLSLTEMLAMAEGDGTVDVPPTLRALLAARLDHLDALERAVLERGAVEGEVFHRGAVQALAPPEAPVTPKLAALVRRKLIRPDHPQLAGEDGFRFRHLLIRDAAYEALPAARTARRRAPRSRRTEGIRTRRHTGGDEPSSTARRP